MPTYTIINDRYSNQSDEVTFEQLVEMCRENGWEGTELRERGGKVYDERNEVVAEQQDAN